ncbi:MAG: sugar ABC transporter substrate-binding protein [bacterium]
MRKIWSGMLVVLLLSIVAAGCGRQADKRVVITFASAEAGAEQIAIMQKIIGRFEKAHPGIKVKLDWGTTQQKILTQIAGGNPPDVFMWWSGITDLAKRDVLLPLNRFVNREGIDMEQYYKCLVDYYTFDGRLYAFPMQLKTNCIIYNKDIFDKAKVAYPQENWTWDDYCRIAEKLTGDSDNDGIRDRFGASTVLWFEWLLWSGCSVLDNDGKKCILDSDPHVRKVLPILYKFNKDICPTPAEASAFTGSGAAGAQGFLSQRVAMQVAPAFMLSALMPVKNFRWDIAPLPQGPLGENIHTFDDAGLCIPRTIKHPEEAFKFVAFYCNEENQKLLGTSRNGIPANRKAAEATYAISSPVQLYYYLKEADKADTPLMPRIRNYMEIIKPLCDQMDLFFLGRTDLDSALRVSSAGIRSKLQKH